MSKTHLATISILVKDRQSHSADVNKLLTENGHLILCRMGINVQRHCIEHCTAIINIIVEADLYKIHELTHQLNDLYGVVAKENVLTE